MKKTQNISDASGNGLWARAENIAAHCDAETKAELISLCANYSLTDCVWRSDVRAILAKTDSLVNVFNNWMYIAGIDQATFSLELGIDGPIPVVLLKHFVEPKWRESHEELTQLVKASGTNLYPIVTSADSYPSQDESDAAASERHEVRKRNQHRLLTGLCSAFMRGVRAACNSPVAVHNEQNLPVQGSPKDVIASCIDICQHVASMYPLDLWPDGAHGTSPSAAQLARSVANMIETQIRAIRI